MHPALMHLPFVFGHLRPTLGHFRHTLGHFRHTLGHFRHTLVHFRYTLMHFRVIFGHLLEYFALSLVTPLCLRASLTTPPLPLGLTIIGPCLLCHNPQTISKWAGDNISHTPLRADLCPLMMVLTFIGLVSIH